MLYILQSPFNSCQMGDELAENLLSYSQAVEQKKKTINH